MEPIRQLWRCQDDLAATHANVLKSRLESVLQFEHQYENTIRDLGRKAKLRYIGSMAVAHCTLNGLYHFAELDGTMSNLRLWPSAWYLIILAPTCQYR